MCAAKISEQVPSTVGEPQPAEELDDVEEDDWNVIEENIVNNPDGEEEFDDVLGNTILEENHINGTRIEI